MRDHFRDVFFFAGTLTLCFLFTPEMIGCTPDYVVKTHPVVYFAISNDSTENQAYGETVLIIRGSRKAERIALDGKPRLTPFTCSTDPVIIDMSGHKESVERRIRNLAFQKGNRRVFLANENGDLIARGRMCIFPTFETQDLDLLGGYEVSIPIARILKRRGGRRGLIFQSYRPLGSTNPSLRHIAWVLLLDAE